MGTPNKSIQVEPAESALGAEISGVDLAGDLSAQTISEIRSALLEHLVIFFRGQSHITSDQQARFARRFGDLVEYPMVKGLDGTASAPRSSASAFRVWCQLVKVVCLLVGCSWS